MAGVQITMLGGFDVAVDGTSVASDRWGRRGAASLVKVLALEPGRRLHREQVIDRLWPDDDLERALPKLHKAAHFARRILDEPTALVLRGDSVVLFPDTEASVDVVEFEELARRGLADEDVVAANAALALYVGELLPEDRYELWAEERREQLRLRHLDLLRLAGRWDTVIELDPSDERAHFALMQRHAVNGDRHAALRQFERMDRALQRELGLAPGPEALALRDRLLVEHGPSPKYLDAMIGRDREMSVAEHALVDAAAGNGRVLLISGAAGMGKSTLLNSVALRAKEMRFRVGCGTSARVEGAWPFAPVIEALADLARQHPALLDALPDEHRAEIDRALAGEELSWIGGSSHQRLFVASAELVRSASASGGFLLLIDDAHDADDGTLRLVHYLARSMRQQRVCVMIAHRSLPTSATLTEVRQSLIERHAATAMALGPLDERSIASLVRRHQPDAGDDVVERVVALSRGVPFAVDELARRAVTEPRWVQSLDANMVGGIAPATRDALQRVAVVGTSFDTDEFVALSGLSETEAFTRLDDALAGVVIEPTGAGYRFRHGLVRDALLDDLPPHRRRAIHRDAAARLIELHASPARVGHHLLEAGAARSAVPYLLRAAETEAAVGAYRDALAVVESVRPHATGEQRRTALALRADLLNAVGDPAAVPAYREALEEADARDVRSLRVRLARCAVMSGDIATATVALDGLETDGGEDDADILLERGKCAFFSADFEAAQVAADEAQKHILAGERSWKVLDMVTLQGLLAHRSGGWFDRMRLELVRTRDDPELANAIFDGYLCAAEYMLYGPTPYSEVITTAREVKATADRSGALRAAAFAAALIGEAALLSGDLDLAAAELTEARDLHHDLASAAGEAISLQRLAEVRVAQADMRDARRLLQQALPLARASIVARHLLHRVFGTMVTAASDPLEARAVVDRAEATLGWEEGAECAFCSITFSIPAVLACIRAGDISNARRHLGVAEGSVLLWEGTSWEAALAEAQSAVALADGDHATARARLEVAIEGFQRAGQPLDAERCRQELADR